MNLTSLDGLGSGFYSCELSMSLYHQAAVVVVIKLRIKYNFCYAVDKWNKGLCFLLLLLVTVPCPASRVSWNCQVVSVPMLLVRHYRAIINNVCYCQWQHWLVVVLVHRSSGSGDLRVPHHHPGQTSGHSSCLKDLWHSVYCPAYCKHENKEIESVDIL